MMGVRVRRVVHAVLASVVASVLVIAAPVAFGQDNPAAGQTLFSANGVMPCTNCHVNVENRRAAIDPGGDLDFDMVFAAFLNAINTQGGMNAYNNGLTTQQKRNIAAYIADVPKARPNLVDFNVGSTNTETAATTITFSNAMTATAPLTLGSVGLTGSAADFLIKTTGTTCSNNQVLAIGASCNVSVSFRTSTGSSKVALLNFPYSQSGSNVTRTAQLAGTVANQPPPSSATGGGGGALGAGWAGLLLFALGLRRRVENRY